VRRVYIETSVVSYLVARDSRDSTVLGRQNSTRAWWMSQKSYYELFVSEVVLEEAGRGNPSYASLRVEALDSLPVLAATPQALLLAERLVNLNAVPATAAEDAAHIAIAAVHSMDYLLTWNFRHINQASKRRAIEAVCVVEGFVCPVICSPDALMGEKDES